MRDKIKKAIIYMMEDAKKDVPLLINCIFDVEELLSCAGIDVDPIMRDGFMDCLEDMHIITKTNKRSPNGPYYNLSMRMYHKFRIRERDRVFVTPEMDFSDGYCIIAKKSGKRIGESRVYRQKCRASGCRFFLKSENTCVKNKIFT